MEINEKLIEYLKNTLKNYESLEEDWLNILYYDIWGEFPKNKYTYDETGKKIDLRKTKSRYVGVIDGNNLKDKLRELGPTIRYGKSDNAQVTVLEKDKSIVFIRTVINDGNCIRVRVLGEADIEIDVRKEGKKNNTVYLATFERGGLEINPLEIKDMTVDIKKQYNDDLPYQEILTFAKGNQEGLCLLHGEPGTGKTTLIKKLIKDCGEDTKFIIITPDTIGGVDRKDVLDLFVKNQGAVYVLEDCENLLSDRGAGNGLTMLLNMTDGLLGSALNTKFICTFNTKRRMIDQALLRNGRLRVEYEFKKLSKDKVSDIRGDLNQEMTLADIFGSGKTGTRHRKVGF